MTRGEWSPKALAQINPKAVNPARSDLKMSFRYRQIATVAMQLVVLNARAQYEFAVDRQSSAFATPAHPSWTVPLIPHLD